MADLWLVHTKPQSKFFLIELHRPNVCDKVAPQIGFNLCLNKVRTRETEIFQNAAFCHVG